MHGANLMKQLSDAQVMGQVQRALLMTASGPAPKDVLDRILAMTREKLRQEKLHRQIGALKGKLVKYGDNPVGTRALTAHRLRARIKTLEGELRQPELNL